MGLRLYRLPSRRGRQPECAGDRRIGSVWVLDIPNAKNEGSIRKVPLHPKLIAERFIEYVKSLPPGGPLLPDLTVGKYGRAGTATKSIGPWMR